MKRPLPILLIFIIVLISCERDFDIDTATSGVKLFLQCCPGPGDTTILQLNRTVPIGSKADTTEFLKSADIDVIVNGTALLPERAMDLAGTVPYGSWYVVAPLKAGDEIAVKARIDGLEPISATTSIPGPAPRFTYKCCAVQVMDHYDYTQMSVPDSVHVTFRDDPATEDWYGLALLCERTIVDLDNGEKLVERVNAAPVEGTVFEATEYIDIPFNGWAFGYNRSLVRVWPDAGFSGQEVTLGMPLTGFWLDGTFDVHGDDEYARFFMAGGVDDNGEFIEGNFAEHYRYKVRLYRFSREFFNYGKALDHIRNNSLANLGLAPAAYAYTNVIGGVGILAGWTVRETDWLSLF